MATWTCADRVLPADQRGVRGAGTFPATILRSSCPPPAALSLGSTRSTSRVIVVNTDRPDHATLRVLIFVVWRQPYRGLIIREILPFIAVLLLSLVTICWCPNWLCSAPALVGASAQEHDHKQERKTCHRSNGFDLLEALHANPAGGAFNARQVDIPRARRIACCRSQGARLRLADEESGVYRATLKLSLIGAKYFSTTGLYRAGAGAQRAAQLTGCRCQGDELTGSFGQGGDHILRDGAGPRSFHITATSGVWLASMSDERRRLSRLPPGW